MDNEEPEEDSFELYKLKKILRTLEKKKGYHTELISLYIPPDKRLSDVTNYLKQEQGQASNIKSKTTRKNVIDCITTILGQLRIIKNPPENGMVFFCGAIPQSGPGTERIELYPIEPPPGRKINTYKYHCSAEFYLEPLRDLLIEKATFGLVAMDRSGATIATIKGNELNIIESITSGIQGKHKKGGQSQRRFERLIEQQAHEFFVRLGEHMNKVFITLIERGELEGVIIGGAGPTKRVFAQSEFFDYRIRDKLLLVVDTGYSNITGVREIIEKSEGHLEKLRYLKEKNLVQSFLGHLARDTGLVTYGEKEVRQALEQASVDILLISESVDRLRATIRCPNCEYSEEKTLHHHEVDSLEREIANKSCPKCESSLLSIESIIDIIEELGDLAKSTGAKVEVISPDTEEGEQLWSGFGGIAAILRYKIEE
ncbi:MAG: peptide chain release factor aRF-1 [Candidatus Helarchaeota archaeon]|nr:peptide chain release factor aRF-1 [Candidatus Helarchaeota archaeon]